MAHTTHQTPQTRAKGPFPGSTAALVTVFTGYGVALVTQPNRWVATSAYKNLMAILDPPTWGVVYIVAAAGLLLSIFVRHSRVTVLATHAFAAALTLGWDFAFIVRYLTDHGTLTSPPATTAANPLNWALTLYVIIQSVLFLTQPANQPKPE